MTAVLSIDAPEHARTWADRAIGTEARTLRELFDHALDRRSSVALGQGLWDLDHACFEAIESNWDGYGALPVQPNAYPYAEMLLRSLPFTTPKPDIGIDPDGEISFTWYRGPRNVFSISIGGAGRLSYAGFFGASSVHGTEYLVDKIPEMVEDNLARLFPGGTQAGR